MFLVVGVYQEKTCYLQLWMYENDDIEGVRAYIDEGSDVNEEHHTRSTGLMRALHYRQNNVVELLLNQPEIDLTEVNISSYPA